MSEQKYPSLRNLYSLATDNCMMSIIFLSFIQKCGYANG